MARQNFDRSLALVLAFEGGYADHPADPGGATNLGITRAVLAEWRGRPVSKEEVRALTRQEAAAIYRRRYWEAVGGDELPAGIDVAVFDYAVNSGVDRASRALQGVLGVPRDGIVGVETVKAARAMPAAEVIRRLCAARRGFLERLRIFAVFGRGWLARVRRLESFALALAGETPSPTPKQETTAMDQTKSVFESRTVWANVIGLAALAANVLGFNTGIVDQGAMVDAVLNMVTGLSFVASTLFRVKATRQLG